MELDKIRELTDEDLKSEETKAAEQVFRIRFAKSLGKQDGVKNLRSLKVDIARFKTIARERQLAAAKEGKK
ncbi:MAG: 50S ribosomal protein L29 [Bryocella sp.]